MPDNDLIFMQTHLYDMTHVLQWNRLYVGTILWVEYHHAVVHLVGN